MKIGLVLGGLLSVVVSVAKVWSRRLTSSCRALEDRQLEVDDVVTQLVATRVQLQRPGRPVDIRLRPLTGAAAWWVGSSALAGP